MSAIPMIDLDKCTGCGDCVEQCPTNAVELVKGKATVVRPEHCNYCTDCEVLCPSRAIMCPFDIVLVVDKAGSLEMPLEEEPGM